MGTIGKLEDGIPPPEKSNSRQSTYPWDQMKVGQSFLVSLDYGDNGEGDVKELLGRIRNAALHRKKAAKKAGREELYVVAAEVINPDDPESAYKGVRVWRTK